MEENYLELCVAILCVFSRLENALSVCKRLKYGE